MEGLFEQSLGYVYDKKFYGGMREGRGGGWGAGVTVKDDRSRIVGMGGARGVIRIFPKHLKMGIG